LASNPVQDPRTPKPFAPPQRIASIGAFGTLLSASVALAAIIIGKA